MKGADGLVSRGAFGLFIHWGPVALKGTNIGWTRGDEVKLQEYDNLYKRFTRQVQCRRVAKIRKRCGNEIPVWSPSTTTLLSLGHQGHGLQHHELAVQAGRDERTGCGVQESKASSTAPTTRSSTGGIRTTRSAGRAGMLKPNMPKYFQYMRLSSPNR